MNDADTLASHYLGMIPPGDQSAPLADLAFRGGSDQRLGAIIRHTDLVAANPRDATGGDIKALKSAGVAEDDIVRLSELIAFVSYQVRVVAGLRLLAEAL